MRVSDSMLALGRARRPAAAGPTERSEVCGRTSARYSASRPTSVGITSSRDALPRRTIRPPRQSMSPSSASPPRSSAPAAQPASESRSHEPGPDRRDHSCPAATARGRPAAPRECRVSRHPAPGGTAVVNRCGVSPRTNRNFSSDRSSLPALGRADADPLAFAQQERHHLQAVNAVVSTQPPTECN